MRGQSFHTGGEERCYQQAAGGLWRGKIPRSRNSLAALEASSLRGTESPAKAVKRCAVRSGQEVRAAGRRKEQRCEQAVAASERAAWPSK